MNRRNKKIKYPKQYCPLQWFKCTDVNAKGQGIIQYHNKPFYIDELMSGEIAKVVIYHENNNDGQGRAMVLKKKSNERVLPLGHWKFSIGSYHIPHWSNELQDRWKTHQIQKLYPHINVPKIKVGKRTYYRNKVVLHEGGFMPPGPYRRFFVKPPNFDLMKIDFKKYESYPGTLIIRRLNTEIIGAPGTQIDTTVNLLNIKMKVNLNSFLQVNLEMMELVLKIIQKYIQPKDIVVDLFAGIGTIGLQVAANAKRVYCVEINPNCVKDCQHNIELNHLNNTKVILADANSWTKNLIYIKPSVIIVNPARAGLNINALNAINNSFANNIIYLACNPYKQAADIKYLTNYQITKIQPFDFFPQTYHIENLLILKNRN